MGTDNEDRDWTTVVVGTTAVALVGAYERRLEECKAAFEELQDKHAHERTAAERARWKELDHERSETEAAVKLARLARVEIEQLQTALKTEQARVLELNAQLDTQAKTTEARIDAQLVAVRLVCELYEWIDRHDLDGRMAVVNIAFEQRVRAYCTSPVPYPSAPIAKGVQQADEWTDVGSAIGGSRLGAMNQVMSSIPSKGQQGSACGLADRHRAADVRHGRPIAIDDEDDAKYVVEDMSPADKAEALEDPTDASPHGVPR